MTINRSIADDAEGYVRRLSDELTRPRAGECLYCYMARLLEEFPCDGSHRLALRYRDLMAPRATALLDRLSQVGGCCCDCEVFLNGYRLRGQSDDDDQPLPACEGVRRGSVQPCRNWVRIRRGW